MKVSITMSENFEWGYNEAETNEHLIAVEKTTVALKEKFAKSEDANIFDDETSNAVLILTLMSTSLHSYAEENDYALRAFYDFLDDEEDKQEELDASKSNDFEIDESQFEVPDQNQKTL